MSPRQQPRGSNFDLMRLGAASSVVLSHAVLVTAGGAWWVANASGPFHQVGDDAVAVFFVISGMLVTASWTRDPDLGRYLARRTLRLMPALVVTIVVTCFVLGPLLTNLAPTSYLGARGTWAYLLNGTLFLQPYQLPGVFANQPYAGMLNGSMWTLRYEFLCYMMVPLAVAAVAVVRSRSVVLVLFGVACIAATCALATGTDFTLVGADPIHIAGLPGEAGWRLAPFCFLLSYFLAGVSIQMWAARIPFDWRVASLAVPLFVASSQVKVLFPLSVVAVAYSVAYFGLRARPVARTLTRFGDASYGIYVWGFVVEQCVVSAVRSHVSALTVFVVAAPITWAIGLLSWRLIEKPALRLKPRNGAKPALQLGQPGVQAELRYRPERGAA